MKYIGKDDQMQLSAQAERLRARLDEIHRWRGLPKGGAAE